MSVQLLITACALFVSSYALAGNPQLNNDDDKSFKALHFDQGEWKENKQFKFEDYFRGGQDLGGGNTYEIEFKAIGAIVFQQLKSYSQLPAVIDLDKFKKALSARVISTTDRLFLDEHERHAVNSRKFWVIVFNEDRWKAFSDEQKKLLALHEYLRFCDVDDSNYLISSELIRRQQLTLIPPSIDDITHQIDLPENFWSLEDGSVPQVLIDGTSDTIRLIHPTREHGPLLSVTVSDPIFNGKKVYYGIDSSPKNFSAERKAKALQCQKKIKIRAPLTRFIVGERHMNILECYGPMELQKD